MIQYTNRKRQPNYVPDNTNKFDTKLISWFGHTDFDVLHIDSDGFSATYTIWIPANSQLIIARVFSLGDKVEISIDKEFEFFV